MAAGDPGEPAAPGSPLGPTDVGPARAPSAADRFAVALATGLGAGYAPAASGTVGSLVGIPLYLAVARLSAPVQLVTVGAFIAVAVWAADRAGAHFGRADDGRIVVDEIAGLLVSLALVPPSVLSVAAGFAAFRAFDVLKPWPASVFDRRVHNGFGVVLDDVVAGLYARAVVAAVLHVA